MAKNYYILSSGRLRREENTVYFENVNGKKAIPINDIYAIYAYGELDINTKLLNSLTQKHIPIHFFNYYGYYSGSYFPREYLHSGFLVVKQAAHYMDKAKRLKIAKEIINTASYNILKNLQYYRKQDKNVDSYIEEIEKCRTEIDHVNMISELMSVEGRIRSHYYSSFSEILREGFELEKRVKMPPDNMMNCLISFGNSLMSSTPQSEIYNTQLNPTISFLHEPFERRFSLALDVSEIFKPIIIDRIILKIVNKNMLDDGCFRGEIGDMLLSDKGKKLFLTEYNEKLSTTIKHRGLEQ